MGSRSQARERAEQTVSGTLWEGSMCVKLGEETQLPEEANRVQAGREEGASRLHQARLSHGGERRERPPWGSARSTHRCEGLRRRCPVSPASLTHRARRGGAGLWTPVRLATIHGPGSSLQGDGMGRPED